MYIPTEVGVVLSTIVWKQGFPLHHNLLSSLLLIGLVFVVSTFCLVGLIIQQCRYRERGGRRVVARDDEYAPLLNAGGRVNTNI